MTKFFLQITLTLSFCLSIFAQESTYDQHDVFGPSFYNTNGNTYRSASGIPGPEYWQNRVDYDIKTQLYPENHKVKGSVTIYYTNNSPDDLNYVWLQLDQNLFKPDSRGQMMISGNSRYGNRGEKLEGGYAISDVSVKESGFTYLIEDTRMQIRLSKPIAKKGGKATISMNFEFIVPVNGSDRMGHLTTKNGEIYTIAQWFPRMCVYDDVLGWNTMPYLGAGEFYCEFGDVNLDITAPENHTVFASGELLNAKETFTSQQYSRWEKAKKSKEIIEVIKEEEVAEIAKKSSPKNKTWKYRMENTRDVAWASSPAFVVDASAVSLPSGKSCLAVAAHPVESNGSDSYGRGCEYVKTSIEHYSEKWFEYPYPMAINIASNQGGMEYPGIVFCGWKAKNGACWGVIDHEFGHIWFPMIVGSNERKYGWMDEGFNTFINEISSRHFNNGEYKADGALPVSKMAAKFANPETEHIFLCPDAMHERNIGTQLYWKPGMGLKLLREVIIGEDRFDYAFKEYINQWAYKHPQPEDFFRCMDNAAGEDLSWFWKSWFTGNYTLDQAISKVENKNNTCEITIDNLKNMPMPIVLEAETKSGKKINFTQGVDIWKRNKSWTVSLPTTEEVVKVSLDPNMVMPDVNRDNNSWKK